MFCDLKRRLYFSRSGYYSALCSVGWQKNFLVCEEKHFLGKIIPYYFPILEFQRTGPFCSGRTLPTSRVAPSGDKIMFLLSSARWIPKSETSL